MGAQYKGLKKSTDFLLLPCVELSSVFLIDYKIYQRAGEPTFILNDNLFLIIHGRMRSGG